MLITVLNVNRILSTHKIITIAVELRAAIMEQDLTQPQDTQIQSKRQVLSQEQYEEH